MKPSEVRRRILEEHAELRVMLDEVEALTKQFERGGAEEGRTLREKGLGLYANLAAHMESEDTLLAPALSAAGPAGRHLAERLDQEHREQRELLRYLIGRLSERNRPTILVVRELLNFVEYLRLDMSQEEETMLREDIFADEDT